MRARVLVGEIIPRTWHQAEVAERMPASEDSQLELTHEIMKTGACLPSFSFPENRKHVPAVLRLLGSCASGSALELLHALARLAVLQWHCHSCSGD